MLRKLLKGLLVAAIIMPLSLAAPAASQLPNRAWVAGRTYGGESLDCDLPGPMHIGNIGSRADGAGMCVMSSIEMAALWAGLDEYKGLRDWCAKEPGGGYPSKVTKQLAAFARAKNLPEPRYMQYEGPDVERVVLAALGSGRMAAVTYGWGERYGQDVSHMVNLVKFSGQFACILDNNFPGEQNYEWMPLKEAVRRICHPGKDGWVFVWLAAGPPPSPRNQ